VTDSERGFHPLRRVVHRLGDIAPHRQVQLLCAISVITVAILVTAVLSSLSPTHDSLQFSSTTLSPAVSQIDVAREKYVAAGTALQLANAVDPNVRIAAIAEVGSLNASGETAYNQYLRKSAHLPRERAMQQTFIAHRQAALNAGAALVSQAAPSAAGVAEVTRSSEKLRGDLNNIRGLYETRVQQSIASSQDGISSTQREVLALSGAAILVLLLAFGVASRSARSREERTENLDRALHEDAERNELEARLQRSLEMAHTENAAYELVSRGLTISVPGLPAELLVADSSRAHFRQATTTDEQGGPGCPVVSPNECPAAAWGQTQLWPSSTALDACPHLQGRPTGECSAVCVPVSIAGRTVAVVHAVAPDAHPPDARVVATVELIARKVGERVGMLRAFLKSETQAHTDPLTGLMNRRSLEEKVRGIVEEGLTYVAAYGDLDHFKQLNDVHGHDAGDQALRLFARVLRDTVRPNDLVARYGGEEFVVVLPDCQISDAYAVINRLRDALAEVQAGTGTPAFTVSFGITAARPENTFSQTLEIADSALLKAKATGRDRIVISSTDGFSPSPDPAEAVDVVPNVNV
jgi:diguanylate cyclase (GGDEF)-like protein